jgi:hypothetical protein
MAITLKRVYRERKWREWRGEGCWREDGDGVGER